MKIAIVGIGGTGSAAARHLAKAGHRVVGYEQFAIGHDRGSSHGESRIIRYTYPDLLYTQMMGDAYPLWADLEREAGEELFVRCGGLYFGKADDADVQLTERSLSEAGLPYDSLTPRQVEAKFPAFRLQPDEVGIYQHESGMLRATRCVAANARLAREAGAVLHENTSVQEIRPHGTQVILQTATGEEAFDQAVVTAGAWMQRMTALHHLPLEVTRQQVLYLDIARNVDQFQPGAFPVWIDASTNYYGFPSDGRISGIKLASHNHGDVVDPDAERSPVGQAYIETAVAYASHRLPDLSDRVMHTQTCLYTNTPDEHFVIDSIPGMPQVHLISGCSGHGFKFTVLLGKIAAALATGETYSRDLSRFALSRFRR